MKKYVRSTEDEKRKFSIYALLIVFILTLYGGCNKAINNNDSTSLKDTVVVQLLSFNDLHGQFDEDEKNGGGIANLSAYLKKYKSENENTIIMSAGDQIGGSPVVTALKQDQPTLEIMKEMNVDVVVTGNHEYDEGIDELARMIQGGSYENSLEWEGSEYLNWITGLEANQYNRPIMLQIAGFTYDWHPEKVDEKYVVKVDNMYLKDENKTAITDSTELRTVANIFLAQGGDGFDTFKEVNYEVVMPDLDAFEEYISYFSNKDNNGDGKLGLNKPDLASDPNIINAASSN